MKYYRNTELARLYHVSEKSVRNWIEATEQKRLNLQLYIENGKPFVANTPQNGLIIEQLVEKGRKYKNSRGFKVISPIPKFYETYSAKQILDIISNLTIHKEIPLQYSYVDGGADYWDKYAERLMHEEAPNVLTSTIDLLDARLHDLSKIIGSDKQVNIIDLGPGNGKPIQHLLNHFLNTDQLKRYIAIDISKEMLQITENHTKELFGDRVNFEGYVRDFSKEHFDDLFAEDYAGDDDNIPINLVVLLSGTICNFRSPSQALKAINSSLGINDLFLYTTKLDTPNSRRYFDLGIESTPRPADFLFKLALDLLNIDESLYEIDQFFDETKRARFISMRPTVDLAIEFKLAHGTRRVTLHKNEPILLWRYWHYDTLGVINEFDATDFDLIHATKTNDQEYLLSISRIKYGQ